MSIRIRLKLMGMLKTQLPPQDHMTLESGQTIQDVLERLQIPVESVHVFTVNGSLERNKLRALQDGDELTILPPVGGG